MSFMKAIEDVQPQPLEMLARDYFAIRSGTPSREFCRRAAGIELEDSVIARRLGVAISTVRHWRETGRHHAPAR